MDLLCEAGAMDVSSLPYNSLGIEMAVSIGRPRPPLPGRFMEADEKAAILSVFHQLLQEKDEASLMGQSSLSYVRLSSGLTGR